MFSLWPRTPRHSGAHAPGFATGRRGAMPTGLVRRRNGLRRQGCYHRTNHHPPADAHDPRTRPARRTPAPQARRGSRPTPPAPVKILVVDDHPLILEALRHVLAQLEAERAGTRRRLGGGRPAAHRRAPRRRASCCSTSRCPAPTGSSCSPTSAPPTPRYRSSCSRRPSGTSTCCARSTWARWATSRSASSKNGHAAGAAARPVGRNLCSGGGDRARPGDRPDGDRGRALHPARTTPRELGITDRQAEVLACILQGLPNKLICRRLDLAEGTVKIHVAAILRALNVHNRTQAVIEASRLGVTLDRLLGRDADGRAVPGRRLSASGPAAPTSRQRRTRDSPGRNGEGWHHFRVHRLSPPRPPSPRRAAAADRPAGRGAAAARGRDRRRQRHLGGPGLVARLRPRVPVRAALGFRSRPADSPTTTAGAERAPCSAARWRARSRSSARRGSTRSQSAIRKRRCRRSIATSRRASSQPLYRAERYRPQSVPVPRLDLVRDEAGPAARARGDPRLPVHLRLLHAHRARHALSHARRRRRSPRTSRAAQALIAGRVPRWKQRLAVFYDNNIGGSPAFLRASLRCARAASGSAGAAASPSTCCATQAMLDRLAASGCRLVYFGLETFNPAALADMGKHQNLLAETRERDRRLPHAAASSPPPG